MSNLLDQAKAAVSSAATTATNLASSAATAAQPHIDAVTSAAQPHIDAVTSAAQPHIDAVSSAASSAAAKVQAAAAPYLPASVTGVDSSDDILPSSGEKPGSAKSKLEGLLAERPGVKELQNKGILKGE